MGMLVPARSAIHFDAQYKGMDIEGYCKINSDTVDGGNPAPPGMYKTL